MTHLCLLRKRKDQDENDGYIKKTNKQININLPTIAGKITEKDIQQWVICMPEWDMQQRKLDYQEQINKMRYL